MCAQYAANPQQEKEKTIDSCMRVYECTIRGEAADAHALLKTTKTAL
jgi:hypothetical protein